ncbi:hypothetical protein BO82DRAFT_356014 [Aspergillus uvarum CBS 121591]|uniref:Uncharacterized protein n=1 Tax=Aspergillus uvarum CBS 121591 TaxID=1448315 RepID=A0A319C1B5_9EURO|nr:hypothetical protein BO82DRAFT_356014 [Aspergillus uvarum CBS 121591]PYH79806.1 hypothetical protein BO82DRAFT_356014 [Aspergillus uvarum CBS 121591]
MSVEAKKAPQCCSDAPTSATLVGQKPRLLCEVKIPAWNSFETMSVHPTGSTRAQREVP